MSKHRLKRLDLAGVPKVNKPAVGLAEAAWLSYGYALGLEAAIEATDELLVVMAKLAVGFTPTDPDALNQVALTVAANLRDLREQGAARVIECLRMESS